jgi:hypothetical protein
MRSETARWARSVIPGAVAVVACTLLLPAAAQTPEQLKIRINGMTLEGDAAPHRSLPRNKRAESAGPAVAADEAAHSAR